MKSSCQISSNKLTLWFAVFFLIFSIGCSSLPPIKTPTTRVDPGQTTLSSAQIGLLIQSGVTAAGWRVVSSEEGKIIAEVTPRELKAVVTIMYNKDWYKIFHRTTSYALKYDNVRKVIHPRYNGWVDRLDRIIQTEITRYLVGQMGQTPANQSPATPAPSPAPSSHVQPPAKPVQPEQSPTPSTNPLITAPETPSSSPYDNQ